MYCGSNASDKPQDGLAMSLSPRSVITRTVKDRRSFALDYLKGAIAWSCWPPRTFAITRVPEMKVVFRIRPLDHRRSSKSEQAA